MTTTEMQRAVAEKTGQPCKSRNRASLLKKLGLPAEVVTPRKAKAAPKAARTQGKAQAKKPAPVTPAERHATAMAYVRRAMGRTKPPSLRALCEEMSKAKVQKPRGGTNWWPSSVQNLLRQSAAASK